MDFLVFATNNIHKLREIRQILSPRFTIANLQEIGCHEELPETHETLEENSLEKAKYVFDRYGHACFADDTGLEVRALNGAPGVRSARYAGSQRSSTANIRKLLKELEGREDRSARFRSIVALVSHGETILFEGVVEGRLLSAPRGSGGFGYDPLFVPTGYERTFAEMNNAEKNMVSHRARAIQKLVHHLQGIGQ